jgi:biopolymer transport protein ExbD
MAFSVGGSDGGGLRGRRRTPPALAEMNIIPLVDVVLVLLIIFMITAQAMEFGLEIEVPKVSRVESSAKDLPVLSISRTGDMKLNDAPLSNIHLLGKEIKARFGENVKEVYVRCDRNAVFNTFVQVCNAAKDAGLKVNVVARQEDVR